MILSRKTCLVLVFLALALLGPASIAGAAPPAEPVSAILCRAYAGLDFSYAWGGECWQAIGCAPDYSGGVGLCDGCSDGDGCADCTTSSGCCVSGVSCQHSGTWGADCSGFVSKAWQVPDPHPVEACGVDRYTAGAFTTDHTYWDNVAVSALVPGDAAATSAHVILVVGPKDSYGEYDVMEAAGCTPGIIRHQRAISTSMTGARRVNILQCVCESGQTESQACGDCGTQSRSCSDGCLFTDWSPCEGPDPSGEDALCQAEGLGVCAEGHRRCVAGWLTCEPNRPSIEVCDGLDNDCDGEIDNGTPDALGEGLPCLTPCGEGASQCVDGQVVCVESEDATGCDPVEPVIPSPKSGGCSCQAGRPGSGPGSGSDPGPGSGPGSGTGPAFLALLALLAIFSPVLRRRQRRRDSL